LPALTVSVSSSSPQSCNGVSDASFTLSGSGGNGAAYEYSKDNSTWQSSGTFSSLAGTTYTGYVRNSNRIGTVASVSVGNLGRTVVNATIAVTNVSCNGGADGSIAVSNGTGGVQVGGYTTSLDDVTYYALPKTFYSLSASSQTVYVKDSNGCKQSYGQTITQPTAQVCNITVAAYDSGASDGQIAVVVSGGTGTKTLKLYEDTSVPYTDYSTDNLVQTATFVANNTTYTFTNVACTGTDYWVQCTDSNGCVVHSNTSVRVCGYFNTVAQFKTGNNLTCTPTPDARIYLRGIDYTTFNSQGYISAGMIIYTDGSGTVYPYNTIYDSVALIVYNVSSGVVGTVKSNC